MSRRTSCLILSAFYLLCYILLLGVRDLTIPDETRYGEIPREMLASGEWVSPQLNGVRYFEKPVLGYWLHAASLLAFGQNNFAVRFPSALSVGLTGAVLYALLRRMRRKGYDEDEDRRTEDLAALIFLSLLGVFAIGNTAVLDNPFAFLVTASIASFFLATEEEKGSPRERWLSVLAGVACGLAFLTKGFVAFTLPALVFVPYLIWAGRYRDILRMSALPLLSACAVIAPWAIMIHLREPDYWRFFFWNEHIRRYFATDAQHGRPLWFFFAVGPLMLLPWSFFLPASIVGLKKDADRRSPGDRLKIMCLCWFALPFLFFSLSRGKLPTYILPCFPPFAALIALGLSQRLEKDLAAKRERRFSGGAYANLAFFAILLLAFLYVQFSGFGGAPVYLQRWKSILILDAFVFFGMFCAWAIGTLRFAKKMIGVALSPLLFFLAIHVLIPDLTVEMKMPGGFLEKHRPAIGRDTIVVTDDDTVGAVCWYLKRDDVYVLGSAGELDYGFAHGARERNIDVAQFFELVDRHPGDVVLIAHNGWEDRLDLPELAPMEEDRSDGTGYLIWRRYRGGEARENPGR